MFLVCLWLIGAGGEWFFNTDVGGVLALAIALPLIVVAFGGFLLIPPYAAWQSWRDGYRGTALVAAAITVVMWMPLPPY